MANHRSGDNGFALARRQGNMQPAAPTYKYWPRQDPRDLPPTDGTGHLHWTIQAFSEWGDNGTTIDVVTVEVEAPDEPTAIARAHIIVERNNYRVAAVRESCSLDRDVKGQV